MSMTSHQPNVGTHSAAPISSLVEQIFLSNHQEVKDYLLSLGADGNIKDFISYMNSLTAGSWSPEIYALCNLLFPGQELHAPPPAPVTALKAAKGAKAAKGTENVRQKLLSAYSTIPVRCDGSIREALDNYKAGPKSKGEPKYVANLKRLWNSGTELPTGPMTVKDFSIAVLGGGNNISAAYLVHALMTEENKKEFLENFASHQDQTQVQTQTQTQVQTRPQVLQAPVIKTTVPTASYQRLLEALRRPDELPDLGPFKLVEAPTKLYTDLRDGRHATLPKMADKLEDLMGQKLSFQEYIQYLRDIGVPEAECGGQGGADHGIWNSVLWNLREGWLDGWLAQLPTQY